MSAATALPPPPPPPPSAASYLTNLGLGYAIAIALGFLVLLSSVLLASYLCCRSSSRRRLLLLRQQPAGPAPPGNPVSDGIILPRIIFVAEDDNEESEADQSVAVGLDPSVINSYPKFAFSREAGGVGGSTTCSICLCEYKDSEMLRMMPECRHFFHLLCLDAWLKLNGSCPVCRNSPLPTPLSTPLSEVVPLSQYGEDRRRRR
ncbi:RING-H2 finger protein ATL67 [Rhodamnia argentea]|uniref:RING-H2 finger protein ATL67 n=1 Tax=Rhodamnia argentea TaxID=178133 RepID=A0A8B8Q3H8_9MYRT|nr:RING-H2 finger protein ATL67 [Rhodamnia argentea]